MAFGSAVRGSSHTQRPTFWISRSTMAFAAWIQKSAQNQNAAVSMNDHADIIRGTGATQRRWRPDRNKCVSL